MYVILARIEEETHNYQQIQAFYGERIATSREQAGLKPLAQGKLYPMRDDAWALVQKIFCEQGEGDNLTNSSDGEDQVDETPTFRK